MTTAQQELPASIAIKKLEKALKAARKARREAKATLLRAQADHQLNPSHDTLDAIALAQRDYRARHRDWLESHDALEVAQTGEGR